MIKPIKSRTSATVPTGSPKLLMPHITVDMFHFLKNINDKRRTSKIEDYDMRILNALFARHLVTRAPNKCVKLTPLGKRILWALK